MLRERCKQAAADIEQYYGLGIEVEIIIDLVVSVLKRCIENREDLDTELSYWDDFGERRFRRRARVILRRRQGLTGDALNDAAEVVTQAAFDAARGMSDDEKTELIMEARR